MCCLLVSILHCLIQSIKQRFTTYIFDLAEQLFLFFRFCSCFSSYIFIDKLGLNLSSSTKFVQNILLSRLSDLRCTWILLYFLLLWCQFKHSVLSSNYFYQLIDGAKLSVITAGVLGMRRKMRKNCLDIKDDLRITYAFFKLKREMRCFKTVLDTYKDGLLQRLQKLRQKQN